MGKTVDKIAALAIMLFNFAGFIEDTRMKEEVRQIRTQWMTLLGELQRNIRSHLRCNGMRRLEGDMKRGG
jgi:hypothetical protein